VPGKYLRDNTVRYALAFVLSTASYASADIVADVRSAIAQNNLSGAAAYLRSYRATSGVTPEMLAALSWMARGELDQSNYDRAETYAGEAYQLSAEQLKKRSLDQEPYLSIALGAAIEVEAQVLVARGQRAEAITYLYGELKKYSATSIHARIQKNINLLSLEGKPAPVLAGVSLSKGKPLLLFFWAHWCGDCKAEEPILARLKAKFGPKGLILIAPTQKYGYVEGGQEAPPDVELRYIEQVRQKYYAALVDAPAPVSEANFLRYGVSTTPTLVLVDRIGIVRQYRPGRMTYEELNAKIEAILKSPRPLAR